MTLSGRALTGGATMWRHLLRRGHTLLRARRLESRGSIWGPSAGRGCSGRLRSRGASGAGRGPTRLLSSCHLLHLRLRDDLHSLRARPGGLTGLSVVEVSLSI